MVDGEGKRWKPIRRVEEGRVEEDEDGGWRRQELETDTATEQSRGVLIGA